MSNGTKPAGKKRGSGKCICIRAKHVAVTFLLANVILAIMFLVLIIALAVQRTYITTPKESLICIPCNKMKSNATTNLGSEPAGGSAIKERDDENLMCCGPVERNTEEIATQYHYDSTGQSLIDIAEEYDVCVRVSNNRQTIPKAVGIVEFKPSFIVVGHQKVLWNKHGRTFYTKHCVHLELEGEIFVRQPGYYIVSSQLNIRPRKETRPPKDETSAAIFSHHVDLLSHKYGTTGILMETKQSIKTNGSYFSSYLSAVFKLNKYDRLSVSVSNPELLDINNYNDHFLVYYTYDLQY